MRTMPTFNENDITLGIDNMQIWLVLFGLELLLLKGDRRFFADQEELQNNVKYIVDYLNAFGKNALFENRWTKHYAKKYLTLLSKLSM
ncbi:hypothetical protein [Fictibacillus sp. KU28468]|uniref:hypothetical protein n=1 Tax=Fictibacillus sp. KU28468 TaxID=2991053 RepID=UPI00223D5486|nr:hypothetical protein [Fictibacillus sp. KU28468]UZJ79436.1 hypothetical protein OKX00_02815 [Fictibacillus sp. KU28468]